MEYPPSGYDAWLPDAEDLFLFPYNSCSLPRFWQLLRCHSRPQSVHNFFDGSPGSDAWPGVWSHCFLLFYLRTCQYGKAVPSLSKAHTWPEIYWRGISRFYKPPENRCFFSDTFPVSYRLPSQGSLAAAGCSGENKRPQKLRPYADNCFLPLALLAARTFLPLDVLILLRNPWTFALCLVLGWNVIFMVNSLLSCLLLHRINYREKSVVRQAFCHKFITGS